jgi:hypothetical protein
MCGRLIKRMKYKHVFKIWILANAFIALGIIIYLFANFGGPNDIDDLSDPGMFLFVAGVGVLISVPSLIIMMVFHHFYLEQKNNSGNYVQAYSILIIVINALYFFWSHSNFGTDFDIFYLLSTVSGIAALLCIDWRIKKAKQIEEDITTMNGERSQF